MATEFTLRRSDGGDFGSFEQAKRLIQRHFPTAQFAWTTSGLEKIRLAEERGVTLPANIRQMMESLPSLLEGVAAGDEFHVWFGLGYQEPVECLYITPRGELAELEEGLAGLEAEAGSQLKVSGSE